MARIKKIPGGKTKKVKTPSEIDKKIKRIKNRQEKRFKESLNPPGLPKLHKDATMGAQLQRMRNIKLLKAANKAEEARIRKLTLGELIAEGKGSGDLASTLGYGNPGGVGGQVHSSPPKWKLDTEYAKGGSVRKQRRLAKRGWGVTKRK